MDEKQVTFITRQNTAAPSVPLGPNKVTFLLSGEEPVVLSIFNITQQISQE